MGELEHQGTQTRTNENGTPVDDPPDAPEPRQNQTQNKENKSEVRAARAGIRILDWFLGRMPNLDANTKAKMNRTKEKWDNWAKKHGGQPMNSNQSISVAALLLGAQLSCGISIAQSGGYHREHRTASCAIDIGGLKGTIDVFPSDDVLLDESADIVWIMAGGNGALRQPLPFTRAGGAQQLSDSQVLVSGTSVDGQTVGHILRLELDLPNATIHIREHQLYPGYDFVDLAWDSAGGILGVIDTSANTLLFGPLAGAPAIPTDPVLPTTLSVAVDAQQSPALGEDDPVLIPNPTGAGFRFGGDRRLPLFSAELVNGVWQVTPPSYTPNNNWHADASRGHAQNLRIVSLASNLGADNSFEVLDVLHGTAVASGAVTAVKTWCEIGPVANFYEFPGFEHVVTGPLSNQSRVFHPLLRYGAPTPALTNSPIVLGNADTHAQTIFVGSQQAMFYVPTTVPAIPDGTYPSSTPSEFHGFLLIGLGVRGPGAPADPIIGTGENARLDFTIALELTHEQFTRTQTAAAAIPVPDLPFLTDFVLLTQWAFQDPADPSELFYSDICGARFRPGTSQSLMAGGGGGSGSTSSSSISSAGAPLAPGGSSSTLESKRKKFRTELMKDPRALEDDNGMLRTLRINAGGE